MANIFKKLGKAVTSPIRGAVNIVKNPKKGLRNLGKSWEKVDDIVLPAVGFAIGGPAGAGLGAAAARGIGDGKFNAGQTLKHGALGYAGGAALQGLGGFGGAASKLGGLARGTGSVASSGLGKLGSLAKGAGDLLGNTAKNALMTDGGFDMGKLAALLTAGSALKGSADKRKGADAFNASNAALRQQMFDKLGKSPDYSALLERITARPNYTFDK